MPNHNSQLIDELLAQADIMVNGKRHWDIQIHSDHFYQAMLSSGSLGLGEAYMNKEWDCTQIDVLITKLIQSNIADKAKGNAKLLLPLIESKLFNLSPRSKVFEIAQKHYDLGNDLFEAMLDKRMVYTCAYWKYASNLDEAQEDKLQLICKKIGLKRGMRVLDIGGGWGSFAKYAAENYGVSVVNITISKEQVDLANKLCQGLKVKNRLQDYRDIDEKFDRIVSLGMFEHVGHKNYDTYMNVALKNLKPDGLFLLHTIGTNSTHTLPDPWIEKYIFPNSILPSLKQITQAVEGKFIVEDVHNFGADYDKTLMAWYKNFEKNWPKLKDNYDNRFYRMWRLYLLSCAGAFRTRNIQLWQIVLSPKGVAGGYRSVR